MTYEPIVTPRRLTQYYAVRPIAIVAAATKDRVTFIGAAATVYFDGLYSHALCQVRAPL